jgi:hypothetical protein
MIRLFLEMNGLVRQLKTSATAQIVISSLDGGTAGELLLHYCGT